FPADGSEAVMEESTATFYDVRANQPHRNAEYRLYYPAALEAIENAVQGDLLVIARPSQEERVLVIIAAQGAPEEHQLAHLFGFEQPRERFQAIGPDELDRQSRTLDYTARYILDALGIETDESLPDDEKYLQEMVTRFDGAFPTTRESSSWARSTVGGTIDPLTDPDTALMAWVEREEQDRKSTRLNSSHVSISYAVFCWKKKTFDPRGDTAPRRSETLPRALTAE